MSKARLVITAVVVEGRSQSGVAGAYGVSQPWISRLVSRYHREGEAAFEPRSRRPHTSPTRLAQSTIDLIVELREKPLSKGLDAGPHTIAWHLDHHHAPARGRPRSHPHPSNAKASYIRFAAELPNERWQADVIHWWLADQTHVEILCWIDDHSRCAISVTAHRRVTGPVVLKAFRKACAAHSIPASTLTDNGMVFTTRLAGGKGGRNALEAELRRLGVVQINSTPNHPPPAARWNASTKPSKSTSPTRHGRPHYSLPHRATPATAYTARPKANPGERLDSHRRVRADRVDDTGSITLCVSGRLRSSGCDASASVVRVVAMGAPRGREERRSVWFLRRVRSRRG